MNRDQERAGRREPSKKDLPHREGREEDLRGRGEELRDEDDRAEGRSARERRVYEEKKAASLGPSGP